MKNTKKITLSELEIMLANWKGASPASVSYITEPSLNKQGKEKFGQVTKIANSNIFLGVNYQNSVNNQREREAMEKDFIAKPLWNGKGQKLSSALVNHIDNGTKYMAYMPIRSLKAFYFDAALNILSVDLLKPFFPERKNESQGTEKIVAYNVVKLANIRKLKVNKITYEIIK